MKSKKELVRQGMIAFLQDAEVNYKSKCKNATTRKIKVKAKQIWEFINDRFPQIMETKYRPSTIKSMWSRINSKFNNKFELIYDVKQGPLPKSKKQKPIIIVGDVAKVGEQILASSSKQESKVDSVVEEDTLYSILSTIDESNMYEFDDFSSDSDGLSIDTNESFEKFLEGLQVTTPEENNTWSLKTFPNDTSPHSQQSIDDIFAFIMDQEFL